MFISGKYEDLDACNDKKTTFVDPKGKTKFAV